MSTQLHMFEGMNLVKADYVSKGASDTLFAEYLTITLGRPYSVAQVRQYRKVLGIPNNTPRPESQLKAALADLATAEDLLEQVLNRQDKGPVLAKIESFLRRND